MVRPVYGSGKRLSAELCPGKACTCMSTCLSGVTEVWTKLRDCLGNKVQSMVIVACEVGTGNAPDPHRSLMDSSPGPKRS